MGMDYAEGGTMRHKYLTPWQCLGHAVQWWDERKMLDEERRYKASIDKVDDNLYCVDIIAPYGCSYVFHVNITSGRWSMFSPEQYHYRTGVLGLYKTSDMRQMFLWAQRIMEH